MMKPVCYVYSSMSTGCEMALYLCFVCFIEYVVLMHNTDIVHVDFLQVFTLGNQILVIYVGYEAIVQFTHHVLYQIGLKKKMGTP